MSTPASSQQQQECCICLQTAAARGGEFLSNPGCCGKWFHMSCLNHFIASGGSSCPHCRTNFPAAVMQQATPAPVLQQQLPPPPPLQQQAPPTTIFSRMMNFGAVGRRPSHPSAHPSSSSASEIPAWCEEDVLPANVVVAPRPRVETSTSSTALAGDVNPNDLLSVTIVPEYSTESLAANPNFHARVSVVYNDNVAAADDRNPLDIVCILDNSGSMDGEKIENLKHAVKFVVSTLGDKDRLSLVMFNSRAQTIQGLKIMTAANKTTCRTVIDSIHAGGGTDIYDGMAKGWEILNSRRSTNAASCVFLLTDGQDRDRLEQKKELAKQIRQAGSSLFLFGFGRDHDSEHMNTIANAAEGSFIYIETNDTVIDAFGGAIGSQQGMALRNVQVDMRCLSPDVHILEVMSGSYQFAISNAGRDALVRMADLYCGERRDFLVKLQLPAISAEDANYGILSSRASFQQHQSGSISATLTTDGVNGVISRLNGVENDKLRVRDVQVDVDMYRFRVTKTTELALSLADRNDFDGAKALLRELETSLEEQSVSYRARHVITVELMETVRNSIRMVANRSEYSGGGRAMMSEAFDGYSKQRVMYSKAAPSSYQTARSRGGQSSALMSKGVQK